MTTVDQIGPFEKTFVISKQLSKFFEHLITSTNNELIDYNEWTNIMTLTSIVNKTHVMIFTTKPIQYQPNFFLLTTKSECQGRMHFFV